MLIQTRYSGTQIKVNIKSGVNILEGYSGTGKTFLMEGIVSYCKSNKISYSYIDYRDIDRGSDIIKASCRNKDIVMLDNADLYISNELLEGIKKTAKIIIISLKQIYMIDTSNCNFYYVTYENSQITAEEQLYVI